MKKVYEFKVTLVIDDDHRGAILDAARRSYTQSGGATAVDDEGTEHPIPADEAVQGIDDAIMELILSHPSFDGTAIEVTDMSCDSEETASPYDEASGHDGTEIEAASEPVEAGLESDDDLDVVEAEAYLCRWPNGDFSIVSAQTKREAIFALDEWGDAHPSQVYPRDSFKADFSLTDEGEIVLNDFGAETQDFIYDTCYPELAKVRFSDQVRDRSGGFKPGGQALVAKAVQHERERLRENQPAAMPKTEMGKRLAGLMGASAIVADHYVDEAAKRLLESDPGEDEKPN